MKIYKSLYFVLLAFLCIACHDNESKSEYEMKDLTDYKLLTTDMNVRNPFIVVDRKEKCYYMIVPKAEGVTYSLQAYQSMNLKSWKNLGSVYETVPGFLGDKELVAPEVFDYKDNYYCFVTVSGENVVRGTTILKGGASPVEQYTPMLPNTEDGLCATPSNWQSQDGSLYVDDNGTPWLVFSRSWQGTPNLVGEIYAVQLSEDLTQTIGEPVKLFSATDAKWTLPMNYEVSGQVREAYQAEAPFIWKDETSGNLIMTWSGESSGNYSIGQAISTNGIKGPWIQENIPVYSSDGGHAMIFKDLEGKLKIAYHAPNSGTEIIRIADITITDGKIDRFDSSNYYPIKDISTKDFEVVYHNLPTSQSNKQNSLDKLFDGDIYSCWESAWWEPYKVNWKECQSPGGNYSVYTCILHDHTIDTYEFKNTFDLEPVKPPYVMIIDMKSPYVLKVLETMTVTGPKPEEFWYCSEQRVKDYEYWISNDEFTAPEDWTKWHDSDEGWTKIGEATSPVKNTSYLTMESSVDQPGRYLKFVIKSLHFRAKNSTINYPLDKAMNYRLGPVKVSEIRVKGY